MAPLCRVTAERVSPSAAATARSAAAVAFPSTARSLTATTSAPVSPYDPPTPARAEPGFTRMRILTQDGTEKS